MKNTQEHFSRPDKQNEKYVNNKTNFKNDSIEKPVFVNRLNLKNEPKPVKVVDDENLMMPTFVNTAKTNFTDVKKEEDVLIFLHLVIHEENEARRRIKFKQQKN